ncbi:MAG TPA: glycosyltransferase [Pyrinomonadaceae bacterium]|jgi:glycosyltransferase involved in cell wall biosynthesis|nr:glycosyltransferase [Pyrinomonadaceae bacterium]
MFISVIIPAHNEGRYLSETLKSIKRAAELLLKEAGVLTEVIVVDNVSTDSTSDVALSFGASGVKEVKRNVARVRNTGASFAKGSVLVFIDADTIVPSGLLWRINQLMVSPTCFGGAVDTDYRPAKPLVKIYLQLWRLAGKVAGMAQGATQFCRAEVFRSLAGYDETLFMGEDVDFHWRLKRFAQRQHGQVCFIADIKVVPSTRRFDQWSFWRTLICTNPIYVLAFRRKARAWRGWYGVIPR